MRYEGREKEGERKEKEKGRRRRKGRRGIGGGCINERKRYEGLIGKEGR